MLLQMELSIKQGLASAKYQNPDVTRKHIMNALECYRGLSFKMEPFVFNDGRSMELASLQGTIPVKYKAFSTNYTKTLANLSGTIPVLISGVVYHIPICIWLMDTHPNHAPLCFVKPTSDMQIKMSMYVDHNGKIYLPYLHNWSPTTSDILGVIQIMVLTFSEHPPVYSKPRSDNPAPYPQQVFMPMPGVSTGHHTPYPPYPPVLGPQNPPTPYFPHYPPANQKLVRSEEVQNSTSTGSSSGTITDEHIRASLLSAVEHKLKRRIDEQFAQSRAELEILQQSAAELNQGKTKLDGILDKLNREKSELERNITLLKEKDAELEKAISQLEEQNDIDVDEAVTTTAPLYKQILNAYAEEAATEDAIYYMGEALRRSVIDLDVFLKQVRSLSRKQFMLRALMQKCRQKAGLAG